MHSDDPWELHIGFMQDTFGRRDPLCTWCGEHVWMALQGFYGGGTWTTNQADEGPLGTGSPPGDVCPESPNGHYVRTKEDRGHLRLVPDLDA